MNPRRLLPQNPGQPRQQQIPLIVVGGNGKRKLRRRRIKRRPGRQRAYIVQQLPDMRPGAQGIVRRHNPPPGLHKQRIPERLPKPVQGMTHRRLTNPKPNRRPGNTPLVQHSQKGHQRPQVQVQYINGFHGWNCRAGKPTSQKPQSDRTASHSASSNHEARGALLPARIPICPPGATRKVLSAELT